MSAVSRNGRCFSGEKQQDEVIKMGKYFGTDGFRGEANENLTADHAYKVGRFLGWFSEREERSLVPGPYRAYSSHRLSRWF